MSKVKKYIRWLCFFAIVFSALMNFLLPFLNLPSVIKGILIICDVILLAYNIANIKRIGVNKYLRYLLLIVLALVVVAIISFIINGYSFALFALGFWNTFRFFSFFFAVILLLDEADISRVIKIENILLVVNILAVLYEFLALGLKRDYLSGTFAFMEKGGNAGLLALCIIETCLLLNAFLQNRIKTAKFVACLVMVFGIAAIAELKIVFVFFVIVVIVAIVLNKKGIRTIWVGVLSALLMVTGVTALINLYPEWGNTFSVSGIYNNLFDDNFGYSSKNDISRGRAFSQIDELFYADKPLNKFFGFGAGNCDSSSFLNLYSDCYSRYEETLHYDWFTHSMVYLELGLLGFILFFAFFVGNIVCIFLIMRKEKNAKRKLVLFSAFCFGLFCIISIWYDSFLRIGYAYFAYAFMALPYIYIKTSKKTGSSDNIETNNKDEKLLRHA